MARRETEVSTKDGLLNCEHDLLKLFISLFVTECNGYNPISTELSGILLKENDLDAMFIYDSVATEIFRIVLKLWKYFAVDPL